LKYAIKLAYKIKEFRMLIAIPGRETIEIENVILDCNGTIAIDGKLIDGVAELINKLSSNINFHIF
jgi:soluble P-type ATPase